MNKWKNCSFFAKAFAILLAVFCIIGFGTLGDVRSVGEAFELKKDATVVFKLEATEGQTYLDDIYFNVAGIYGKADAVATIRVRRSSSASGAWYTTNIGDYKLDGLGVENSQNDQGFFKWVAPYDKLGTKDAQYKLTTFSYYEISSRTQNILLNEVVFVADNGTVVKATIDKSSNVTESGKTKEQAIASAGVLLDAQYVPTIADSTFFRFTNDEVYTLQTIAEMKSGMKFVKDDVYTMDAVTNTLGLDILALSTTLFGMSPFALRLLPFLATVGLLCVGYFFTKKLAKSDKVAFFFALAFALSGLPLTVGRVVGALPIALFFAVWALYETYGFYADGISEKRGYASVVLGAFASALAICVNGAMVIPTVGVVALFVVGMLRQQKAKAYFLAKAEELPEEEKEFAVKEVNVEYATKNKTATVLFIGVLFIGLVIFSVLALLPVYPVFVKVFDTPASPKLSVFDFMWKGFVGGFVGSNIGVAHSAFPAFDALYVGSVTPYAMTVSSLNVVLALLAVASIVYYVVKVVKVLVKKETGKEVRRLLIQAVVPCAGLVLGLIGLFTASSLAFLTFATVWLCVYASYMTEKIGNTWTVWAIVAVGVAALVSIPFVFSIPFFLA